MDKQNKPVPSAPANPKPAPDPVEKYEAKYQQFKAIYPALKPVYAKIV